MVYLFVSLADMGLSERLYEGLALAAVGMLVVFCALSVTALAIVLLNHLFGSSADTRQTAQEGRRGIEDAHLKVVIAAATTIALGREVNITRIRSAK